MTILDLLIAMLLVFWLVGAIVVIIQRKKSGKCIGCGGGCCTGCGSSAENSHTGCGSSGKRFEGVPSGDKTQINKSDKNSTDEINAYK